MNHLSSTLPISLSNGNITALCPSGDVDAEETRANDPSVIAYPKQYLHNKPEQSVSVFDLISLHRLWLSYIYTAVLNKYYESIAMSNGNSMSNSIAQLQGKMRSVSLLGAFVKLLKYTQSLSQFHPMVGRFGYITLETENTFELTIITFPPFSTPSSNTPIPAVPIPPAFSFTTTAIDNTVNVEEQKDVGMQVNRQLYEENIVSVKLLVKHDGNWTYEKVIVYKDKCTLAILLPNMSTEYTSMEDVVCIYHGKDFYPYCKSRNKTFS